MYQKDDALINVWQNDQGQIEIRVNKEDYRAIIASLSQAMCGAFDVAGEHENVVMATIRELAFQSMRGPAPVKGSRVH